MSTQNGSPENRSVLSRRDFLRHSAVALAWMSLSSFSRGVGQALAAPRKSEPDFSPTDNLDGSSVLLPVNHQAAESNAGILQTGLDQIDVAGEMHRPVIDAEAMKELILFLALIYHDEQTQKKTDRWLEKNVLEIEIFAPGTLSLAAGAFGPSHNGADARIGINSEILKELHFPGSSRHPVIMFAEAVGDFSPETTLPHEIQHFLGWLEHPEDYGGWKAVITNSTSFCLGPILQIAAGLSFVSSRLGKRIHRGKLLGKMAIYTASALTVSQATDMLLKTTVDVHAKEKYDDGAIGKLLDKYPQIAALNLKALSLEPV